MRVPWLTALSLALLVAGCGKKGMPVPPEPRGPLPVTDVAARQVGDDILVSFRGSSPRGDRPNQRPVRAELVRVEYAPGRVATMDPDAFRRRGKVVGSLEASALTSGQRLEIVDGDLDGSVADPAGWTLRYAVRVFDARGRSSPLVVAPDLVAVAPPPSPTGLSAEATADGIRLTWTAERRDPPLKFNVYRAGEGQEFGPSPLHAGALDSTTYLDREVEIGRRYRYEVRSTPFAQRPFRESEPSRTGPVLALDLFAPEAPRGLVVVQEGAAVRLFWNPNDERDLSGYRVYRSLNGGPWNPIGPERVPEPIFLDAEPAAGDVARYRITALDRAAPPNESEPSAEMNIEVVREPVSEPPEGRR